MKKFLKRLLTLTLVLVLSNTGGVAEKVEAAICPPHGEYYDTLMTVRNIGGPHRVQKRFYARDDRGEWVDVTDLLAKPEYVTCIVELQQFYHIVRCKKCHLQIYSYYYNSPEIHSYCPVG